MMTQYKPNTFNVPLKLLIPSYSRVAGVMKKTYPTIANGELIFGSFKTYGGTEQTENNLYSVLDTATVETWYRPDINSECRIAVANTGAIYDIMGEPENIDQRNQYLILKLSRVKGGA